MLKNAIQDEVSNIYTLTCFSLPPCVSEISQLVFCCCCCCCALLLLDGLAARWRNCPVKSSIFFWSSSHLISRFSIVTDWLDAQINDYYYCETLQSHNHADRNDICSKCRLAWQECVARWHSDLLKNSRLSILSLEKMHVNTSLIIRKKNLLSGEIDCIGRLE